MAIKSAIQTPMTINLTPSQLEWLTAEVAAGRFGSIDEAAQAIINEHMARDLGDLDWVQPLLDDARAEVARGEVVTLEAFNAHVDKLVDELRK